MFLIKKCSVTGIFDKSMEHVGTKEIVPYPLYVPQLKGSPLEVLLYMAFLCVFMAFSGRSYNPPSGAGGDGGY